AVQFVHPKDRRLPHLQFYRQMHAIKSYHLASLSAIYDASTYKPSSHNDFFLKQENLYLPHAALHPLRKMPAQWLQQTLLEFDVCAAIIHEAQIRHPPLDGSSLK